MTPFKTVKTTLENNLQFAGTGQIVDQFSINQWGAYFETVRKAKGWEELTWRLQNVPNGLIKFSNHSLEIWKKALAAVCIKR